MNGREKSMGLSAFIGNVINSSSPIIEYDDKNVKAFIASLGDDIDSFGELGAYNGDSEAFYVANAFAGKLGLWEQADDEFIFKFLGTVKKLSSAEFCKNPFISAVKYKETKCGDLLLTYATYEKGEIFQYDMPDFDKSIVVPKVGFFDGTVKFPTIYEGEMPWMSVCPSETSTIDPFINKAFGKVLVLGLGLGYFPFRIAESDKVEKIVIVEINQGIIDLFTDNIFPFFPHKEKFEFVHADALKYLEGVNNSDFDYCFADIWEGVADGLPLYKKIKEQDERLDGIEFDYWIEPQLKAFDKYGKNENE